MERQEEERQRWQTERDEWGRTSEILLARANIEGGRSRELQLEHRNNNVLSQNTSLKNKVCGIYSLWIEVDITLRSSTTAPNE